MSDRKPVNTNSLHSHMISRARKLRRDQTGPEIKFWNAIRNRQLANLRFRRQRPIGKYVVDFYCPEHRFVVELDGESHDESNSEADRERHRWLESQGYTVIRFENDDVIKNLDDVLEKILFICGLES